MAMFVFSMPVLPGKEEADRSKLEGLSVPGPDRDAYLAARRAAGLTREAVWHQKTPMGTFALVLLEADDIQSAFGRMVTSDDPFDQNFREFVRECMASTSRTTRRRTWRSSATSTSEAICSAAIAVRRGFGRD